MAEFDSVIESFIKDTTFSENNTKSLSLSYSDPLKRELFIRYLFSALIDADWLDTEAFFESDKSQSRGKYILPIDEMIKKLEKEFSNKPTDGEINQLRNYARKIALEKANRVSGFYSLNLPTGTGKTLISIAWALRHAKANGLKRIIIVLPYINIIDQTASELKRIFGEKLVLEHHSSYNENNSVGQDDENNLDIIQKRKILACENWDYPIIVTTTVQFFESLFSNKPSKCRKNHNIAESVVIFDEVQSLPKEIILPTLSMLKNIQVIMGASFLFCTATQPAFEKRDKFNGIDSIYPLIDNPSEIFKKTR
ncbi:MAG: DEAD/DEAH box helicase family protein, partial [bacterium]